MLLVQGLGSGADTLFVVFAASPLVGPLEL